MAALCKHCATPCSGNSGSEEFCCAGCEQVYYLIQSEGLADYYRLQDRAAQPLKDRPLTDLNVSTLRRLQQEIEAEAAHGKAGFEVEGMSCVGCSWLVERLATNQAGVKAAEVSLVRNALMLDWESECFDIAALGSELLRFGYRLHPRRVAWGNCPYLSPLALRALLTSIFAANSTFLAAYDWLVASSASSQMVGLLSLACFCFALIIGAAPFFMNVYRSAQIRRMHSDIAPVAMIVAGTGYAVFEVIARGVAISLGVFFICLLLSVLIGARWLGTKVSS